MRGGLRAAPFAFGRLRVIRPAVRL